MKLDFKVYHLPNDTLQLDLSVCLSVRLYIYVSKKRNEKCFFVFSGSSELRLCVAADLHPAHHTSPQQSPLIHLSPPSIWAPLSIWAPPSIWVPPSIWAPPSIREACYCGGLVLHLSPALSSLVGSPALFAHVGCEHIRLPHTSFTFLSVLPCRRRQSLSSLATLVIPCCSTRRTPD